MMPNVLRRIALAQLAAIVLACTGAAPDVGVGTMHGSTTTAGDTSDTTGSVLPDASSGEPGTASGDAPTTTGDDTTESSTGGGIEDPGTLDSDARIYTADGTEYTIDEIGDAFAHALADAVVDNAILYVHGRACGGGGEPEKSLADAMPALESDYTARAVMFVWQGADDGCPLGFPEDKARAAGPALAHALRKLAYARSQSPATFEGRALTLLTHSMGSLVLEQAVAAEATPLPVALFDTAMIGSAASARGGHAAWVGAIAVTDHLYVSGNDDDLVLTAAGVGGVRLGKNVDATPLAAVATYVDFTATSVNHAYYIHDGQDGAPMTAFYDAIMNGQAFDFSAAEGIASVEMRDGTAIYRFSP